MRLSTSYVIKLLVLFCVYFITAKIGLSLSPVSGFATLIWLPSGLSLASLLIFGYKLWPAIMAGAFLANLVSGAPLLSAIGIGIGNTLEPLLGAYLLVRFINFNNSMARLKDVLGLAIYAAFLSTLVSATVGVTSLWIGNAIESSSILSTWAAWWIGDMISVLVIAPLVLVWSTKPPLNLEFKRLAEALVVFLILVITFSVVFRDFFGLSAAGAPLSYLVFPPLIWTALRFGQKGTVLLIFVLSSLATTSTIQGFGPFVTTTTVESLLFLQLFMTVISISAMILAAVFAERVQFEKRKNEFLSIAAHELKTPLTTIKGYAQILYLDLKKNNDKQSLTYISKMVKYIDNLTRLVNDFFDVSKIQANKMELKKESFNMNKLIKETAEDMKQLTKKHKIVIKGKIKINVFADRYRIAQVLINLISNAIKFSPSADKIKIIVSGNRNAVKVSVIDFGMGIPESDMQNVFDRFYQAKARTDQSATGLGLGLYISSEIIKRHKGRIWVESKKGEGATFSFMIPTKGK